MATPFLPSSQSIVDFLKTGGQDSSLSARRKLFNDAGLNKRLGEYVGAPNQNTNLLKQLQTKTTDNSNIDFSGGGAPALTAGVGTPAMPASTILNNSKKEAFSMNPINIASAAGFGQTQTTTPATATLSKAGYAEFKPAPTGSVTGKDLPSAVNNFNAQAAAQLARNVPAPTGQAPAAQAPTGTQAGTGTPAEVSQQADTQTQEKTGGMSASTLFPEIFTESDPNEADTVNSWLNSAEGQLFTERQNLAGLTAEAKAEAAKQALETKYQSEKETLENNLAANGLAFSGIRATKVKALADSLAASTLSVDRELASKLLDANLDLREAILKGVAELAKQAKEGRKEAIQQLNAIGYAVIGNELVPTLAAQSAVRAERSADRADRQLEISEARLTLAEQAAARAGSGNKLTYAETTAKGLPPSLAGQSEEAVIESFYSPVPPDWFYDKFAAENPEIQKPFSPYESKVIQDAWDMESKNYISGVKESNDHAKATTYFKSAYGDALDAAGVKALADRVELYVAGGSSYADAITKVIEEASK